MSLPISNTATPTQGVWTLEAREAAKQRKAFQDFETMFAHMMLKQMRSTMNESTSIEKSHATTMYEEMMDEALAQQMGQSGQLGIGDQLRNTLEGERIRHSLQANEKIMTRGALEPIKA